MSTPHNICLAVDLPGLDLSTDHEHLVLGQACICELHCLFVLSSSINFDFKQQQ